MNNFAPSPLVEVKGALAKFGKTQADLAEAIGRSEGYIYLIINGKRDPGITDCKKIYAYFRQLSEEYGYMLPSFSEFFYT